ncbi:MAG: hypothetical protein P9X24_19815 [Candidatus Hatepunaea meridiana]|nr:hypothetical protein [Candidatus Hatepunaea meridiana]
MNKSHLQIPIILSLLILTGIASAQQFTVEPDSTEGVGYIDSLAVFNSIITNEWDQENLILWVKDADVPDQWLVEICQGTQFCWSPWVDSDTLRLLPNGEDTLQVKFRAIGNPGTGTATLTLTATADTTIREVLTFRYEARPLAVRQNQNDNPLSGNVQVNNVALFGGGSGLRIQLPGSTWVTITAYDGMGRSVGRIWEGQGYQGNQDIRLDFGHRSIPSGIYHIKIKTEHYGSIWTRVALLR